MKCVVLLTFAVVLALCFDNTQAWWRGSSSSSSRSSSSRSNSWSLSRSRGSFFRRVGTYTKQYYNGVKDMVKSYKDMRKTNVIGADKYFHSKGNHNAAKHGPGGVKAAEHISNLREKTDRARYGIQNFFGRITDGEYKNKLKDSYKDIEANEWGRSGGDPNRFRVNGIPKGMRR